MWLALRAHSRGEWFTGADAPTMFDELQYLAWIRDSADHFLVANLFRIGPSDHVFADPMFLISAGVHRLGASVQLSYLVWIPAAIAAMAYGPYAFARARLGAARWPAATAVAIGLFGIGPIFLIVHWAGAHDATLAAAGHTLFPALLLLGGLPFAIAVGLVAATFALAERGRMVAAAVVALLTSWIHPWQGEQIALACLAVFALEYRARRSFDLLAPVVAAALPLAYFALLAHYDSDWRTAHSQAQAAHIEAWAFALVIAPLLTFAIAGLNERRDRGELLLLAWPLACIAGFLVTPSVASHALIGMSLPLAILAVRGWLRLGWSRALGGITAAALVVATAIYGAQTLHRSVAATTQPYSIPQGDRAALTYIAHSPIRGAVLARVYAGALVPAFSGRQTWVGHASWTPQFSERARLAEQLIRSPARPAAAQRFVQATGARFVLADCAARPGLQRDLAPIAASTHRFGCALVLIVR